MVILDRAIVLHLENKERRLLQKRPQAALARLCCQDIVTAAAEGWERRRLRIEQRRLDHSTADPTDGPLVASNCGRPTYGISTWNAPSPAGRQPFQEHLCTSRRSTRLRRASTQVGMHAVQVVLPSRMIFRSYCQQEKADPDTHADSQTSRRLGRSKALPCAREARPDPRIQIGVSAMDSMGRGQREQREGYQACGEHSL